MSQKPKERVEENASAGSPVSQTMPLGLGRMDGWLRLKPLSRLLALFDLSGGSLSRRFGMVFFLGSALTLLGAVLGFVIIGVIFAQRAFEAELVSVARVVGSTSRAALAFNDRDGCERVLSALQARGDVVFGVLRNVQGVPACSFGKQPTNLELALPQAQERVTWSTLALRVAHPVTLDGEQIGDLVIEAKLDRLYSQFLWVLPIGLAIACFAAVGAGIFTKRLKSSLTSRLGSLEQFALDVTRSKNLSGRVSAGRGDEVDALVNSFNQMLEELQERDRSLTAAKERAESADRAKSMFVASMSHELRTPLHAILTIADEVAETNLDAEQRELMSVLRSSGRSLLSIINDVLDFSKIEAGRMTLAHAPFSLRSFIDRTIRMFVLPFKNKGVSLGYSVAPHVPDRLVGDEGRLSQILVNLVGNALKFTPQGGEVMCHVALGESESSQHLGLHFTVADNGVGMAPDKLSEIFDAFTQLPQDCAVTQGTGLGLAITRRLVQAMSGRMWVESELGKGSTFHAVIGCSVDNTPVEVCLNDGDPSSTPAGSDAARSDVRGDSGRGGRARLLVVDDNAVNRSIAQRVLQKMGYEVVLAENGKEAVDLIASGAQINLVLMDVSMPIMDGLEATRCVRRLEVERGKRRRMPIIALTASVNRADSQICMDAGMNAFLEKPIDRQKLQSAIEEFLAEVDDDEVNRGRDS